MYDTPQEWLRRIGRARVQRERESNARNDLHADSDRRVESPKASIPLGMGLVWTQMQIQIQIYVMKTKIVMPNSSNMLTAFIAPLANACLNTKLNLVAFHQKSFDMSREN